MTGYGVLTANDMIACYMGKYDLQSHVLFYLPV